MVDTKGSTPNNDNKERNKVTLNAFVGSADLKEQEGFPPRPASVGKIIGLTSEDRIFDDKPSTYITIWIDPLAPFAGYFLRNMPNDDGTPSGTYAYPLRNKVSQTKNSLWGIFATALDAAVSEVIGQPIKLDSTNIGDIVGLVVKFGEVDRASDLFKPMGKMQANIGGEKKRHPVFVLGAPDANWAATVPVDFAATKAEMVANARKSDEEYAAGQGSIQPTQISVAPVAANVTDMNDVDQWVEVISGACAGLTDVGMTMAMAKNLDLKALLPTETYNKCVRGQAAKYLFAKNVLTKDASGTYQLVGAPALAGVAS